MTTISTDLYTDITFTLIKCELFPPIIDLLLTNTHVNHVGCNVVIRTRNAKIRQPPDEITRGRCKIWLKNNKMHRDWDLPAVFTYIDDQKWYKNGQRHRYGDKPAHLLCCGARWYKNDVYHRDGDKPAVVLHGGYNEWWKNGKQHRDGDLPAIIRADGTKEWWTNDILQRKDDTKNNTPHVLHIYL